MDEPEAETDRPQFETFPHSSGTASTIEPDLKRTESLSFEPTTALTIHHSSFKPDLSEKIGIAVGALILVVAGSAILCWIVS